MNTNDSGQNTAPMQSKFRLETPEVHASKSFDRQSVTECASRRPVALGLMAGNDSSVFFLPKRAPPTERDRNFVTGVCGIVGGQRLNSTTGFAESPMSSCMADTAEWSKAFGGAATIAEFKPRLMLRIGLPQRLRFPAGLEGGLGPLSGRSLMLNSCAPSAS